MITAVDEEQAESYELQLKAKLDNKEIPTWTKYVQCYIYVQYAIVYVFCTA